MTLATRLEPEAANNALLTTAGGTETETAFNVQLILSSHFMCRNMRSLRLMRPLYYQRSGTSSSKAGSEMCDGLSLV